MSTGNSSYSAENTGFKVHTEELFYCFHETVGLNFMLVDVDSDGLPDLLRNQRGKVDVYLNENGKINQTPNMRFYTIFEQSDSPICCSQCNPVLLLVGRTDLCGQRKTACVQLLPQRTGSKNAAQLD